MTISASVSAGRLAMHRRRKRVNAIALTLALLAMGFGVFWLIWILVETVRLGIGGMSFTLFTESTPAAMSEGGEIIHVETFAVGPSMRNDVGHCLNACLCLLPVVPAEVHKTCDSTHVTDEAP